MIGYPLDMYKHELKRVPAHRTKKPALTFDLLETLGPVVRKRVDEYFGEIDPDSLARRLPAPVLRRKLSFDELCKLRYSQIFMMHPTVVELFDQAPEFEIVRKIENCMWRWGFGSGVWNQLVDAYEGIRNFRIPVDGFDVRLDYTTYCNQRGYSRESRTYLDGVFGFLVYFEGQHVMTLGFSFMKGRRLLVQQVQLTRRKGNRFLFRLPPNRLEFFLECFAAAFPRHTLCVADGGDIGRVSLGSYTNLLERVLCSMRDRSDSRDIEEKEDLQARIEHLEAHLPRLEAFYADTGKFSRVGEFEVNGVRHYPLAA